MDKKTIVFPTPVLVAGTTIKSLTFSVIRLDLGMGLLRLSTSGWKTGRQQQERYKNQTLEVHFCQLLNAPSMIGNYYQACYASGLLTKPGKI